MVVKITEVTEGKTQEELDADVAAQDGGAQDSAAVVEEKGERTPEEEQGAASGDLVVTIGDAPPLEDDENLNFKQLRENRRELARENRELKRKLEATQGAAQTDSALGPKPKLEDFNYDTEKHEAGLEAWLLKKAELDQRAKAEKNEQDRANTAWQEKLNSYGAAKDAFKARAPDFPDAEIAVESLLSKQQQGLLLKASKDAPLMVYALYKSPARLKELAAMADPVEFTAELVRTEAQLKVSNRQERKPEDRVGGTVAVGAGGDVHLEKLRAEAARTGDISKVTAYRREQRQKAAKAA